MLARTAPLASTAKKWCSIAAENLQVSSSSPTTPIYEKYVWKGWRCTSSAMSCTTSSIAVNQAHKKVSTVTAEQRLINIIACLHPSHVRWLLPPCTWKSYRGRSVRVLLFRISAATACNMMGARSRTRAVPSFCLRPLMVYSAIPVPSICGSGKSCTYSRNSFFGFLHPGCNKDTLYREGPRKFLNFGRDATRKISSSSTGFLSKQGLRSSNCLVETVPSLAHSRVCKSRYWNKGIVKASITVKPANDVLVSMYTVSVSNFQGKTTTKLTNCSPLVACQNVSLKVFSSFENIRFERLDDTPCLEPGYDTMTTPAESFDRNFLFEYNIEVTDSCKLLQVFKISL